MIATDDLVAACVHAMAESDPKAAVREILTRCVADRRFGDALAGPSAGFNVLYRSPELTVLNVIWRPLISQIPHDHLIRAAIGIYGGQENNAFYCRSGGSIVPSGGKELVDGSVLLLGDDVIHSVHNPARSSHTGAIHVYGGDLLGTPRSQWDADTLEEQPYDLDARRQEFNQAERNFEKEAVNLGRRFLALPSARAHPCLETRDRSPLPASGRCPKPIVPLAPPPRALGRRCVRLCPLCRRRSVPPRRCAARL